MAESGSSTVSTPRHPDFSKWFNYIGQRVYLREISGHWILGTLEKINEDNILIVRIRTATEYVDGFHTEVSIKQWTHADLVEKLFCCTEPDFTKFEQVVD